MTLEKLAQMVAGGFTEVRNEMNERFENVDAKLDDINERVGSVEERIEELNFHVFEMKNKEMVNDKSIQQTKRKVDFLEKKVLAK